MENWLFLELSDTEEKEEQKKKKEDGDKNQRNALVRVVMAGGRDLRQGGRTLGTRGKLI